MHVYSLSCTCVKSQTPDLLFLLGLDLGAPAILHDIVVHWCRRLPARPALDGLQEGVNVGVFIRDRPALRWRNQAPDELFEDRRWKSLLQEGRADGISSCVFCAENRNQCRMRASTLMRSVATDMWYSRGASARHWEHGS